MDEGVGTMDGSGGRWSLPPLTRHGILKQAVCRPKGLEKAWVGQSSANCTADLTLLGALPQADKSQDTKTMFAGPAVQ